MKELIKRIALFSVAAISLSACGLLRNDENMTVEEYPMILMPDLPKVLEGGEMVEYGATNSFLEEKLFNKIDLNNPCSFRLTERTFANTFTGKTTYLNNKNSEVCYDYKFIHYQHIDETYNSRMNVLYSALETGFNSRIEDGENIEYNGSAAFKEGLIVTNESDKEYISDMQNGGVSIEYMPSESEFTPKTNEGLRRFLGYIQDPFIERPSWHFIVSPNTIICLSNLEQLEDYAELTIDGDHISLIIFSHLYGIEHYYKQGVLQNILTISYLTLDLNVNSIQRIEKNIDYRYPGDENPA